MNRRRTELASNLPNLILHVCLTGRVHFCPLRKANLHWWWGFPPQVSGIGCRSAPSWRPAREPSSALDRTQCPGSRWTSGSPSRSGSPCDMEVIKQKNTLFKLNTWIFNNLQFMACDQVQTSWGEPWGIAVSPSEPAAAASRPHGGTPDVFPGRWSLHKKYKSTSEVRMSKHYTTTLHNLASVWQSSNYKELEKYVSRTPFSDFQHVAIFGFLHSFFHLM